MEEEEARRRLTPPHTPAPSSFWKAACARRDEQLGQTFKRGQPAPVSFSGAAGGFDLGAVQRPKPGKLR